MSFMFMSPLLEGVMSIDILSDASETDLSGVESKLEREFAT